ncbi:MAG: hypothetical protein ACK5YO_14265, partial [Planctomyces sp.]
MNHTAIPDPTDKPPRISTHGCCRLPGPAIPAGTPDNPSTRSIHNNTHATKSFSGCQSLPAGYVVALAAFI